MHDDDTMREQFRAADPARHYAPLDSYRLEKMMDTAMTDTATTRDSAISPREPSRAAATARRWWMPATGLTGVAAAAAIAVPLAIGGSASVMALDQPDPVALAAGSCLEVSAESLLAQEQAFAARVLEVDGETVLLEVTERFAGDVADRVEVPQVNATDGDFSGIPFNTDASYLVSATDGTIAGCGLSGIDDAGLRAVYDEAFRG